MASAQQEQTDPDVEQLVENAANDHVTVGQLTGEEKYYPDATNIFEWPHRVNGESLQYLVLLTKGENYKAKPLTGEIEEHANGIGSLVFTERACYYVTTKDDSKEFPYDLITRTRAAFNGSGGTIWLYFDGIEFEFTLARRSDEENVREAYAYLRNQVHEE